MRSLPPPRYSRFRTFRRIWRSIITFLSTGYMSDSAAFAGRSMPSKKRQSPTRIRRSRVTKRPTSRATLVNRVSQTLLNELINEDQIISDIVRRDRRFSKGLMFLTGLGFSDFGKEVQMHWQRLKTNIYNN